MDENLKQEIIKIVVTQKGVKVIRDEATKIFKSETLENCFCLANEFYRLRQFQVQELGVFLFGYIADKNEKALDNSAFDDVELINLNETCNSGDVRASFTDEQLPIADTVSKKVDKNTYVVTQYIDFAPLIAKGVNIKDEFELQINISEIIGWDKEKAEKPYAEKEEEEALKELEKNKDKDIKTFMADTILEGNWNYKFNMKKDDSKNKKYEPNLENNKAILKKVVLTPGTTEVEVDVPKEFGPSAYILAYDDKGNKLEGHTFSYNKKSNLGTLEYRKFTPISKDAEYILVKVVDKNTQNLDVFSEFKVLLK